VKDRLTPPVSFAVVLFAKPTPKKNRTSFIHTAPQLAAIKLLSLLALCGAAFARRTRTPSR